MSTTIGKASLLIFFFLGILFSNHAQKELTFDHQGLLNESDYQFLKAKIHFDLLGSFQLVHGGKHSLLWPYSWKNGQFGIVDSKGNIMVPAIYDEIAGLNISFSYEQKADWHEYISVRRGNKYGMISLNGKEFLPLKYDWIYYFITRQDRKGHLLDSLYTAIIDDTTFIYNTKGKLVSNYIRGRNKTVKATPKKDYKEEAVDKTVVKKERIPFLEKSPLEKRYPYGSIISNKKGKLIFYDPKTKTCCVYDTLTNKIIIPHNRYQKITHHSEDAFITIKNKKYGLHDMTGKQLLPTDYQHIEQFKSVYKVTKEDKMALFRVKGFKQLTPFCLFKIPCRRK